MLWQTSGLIYFSHLLSPEYCIRVLTRSHGGRGEVGEAVEAEDGERSRGRSRRMERSTGVGWRSRSKWRAMKKEQVNKQG